MTSPLHERRYLHNRHRLSHQQIDRMLDEKRSTEFLQEKLSQLEAVRRFLLVTDKLRESGISFVCLKGPLLSLRIYSDPAVRISHDIDLLLNIEDIDPALTYLGREGFVLTNEIAWPQNKVQRELLANATIHVTLWNKQLNVLLEIHWALMNNLPLSREEINSLATKNLTSMNFAGRSFIVLNKELELLYLIIHGAMHGWSRFKWLTDIHDYPLHELDEAQFCRLAEELKAERLVAQTNFLLHDHFNDQYSLPDPWKQHLPPRMIQYIRQNMNKPVEAKEKSAAEIIRNAWYSWYLFPGLPYKRRWASGLLIRPRNIAELNLGSKAAYYLLCPIDYIKKRISKFTV